MPSFYELFLSIVGHVPVVRPSPLTPIAPAPAVRAKGPRRGRKGQAPPVFHGDNRLRADIGLPPLDRHGRPM
jgi:hypothetical protein